MNKWLSIFLILIQINCFAEDNGTTWEDFWVTGIYSCSQKNYNDALSCFNESIRLLETSNNSSFPQIYIDRGVVYAFQFEWKAALNDFDTALESNLLSQSDKIRISVHKLAIFSAQEDSQNIFRELDNLKSLDHNFPQIQITEHYVFIRNVPNNKWYRKAIKCLLIHSGMCSSKDDMYIYPSDILVAVKKGHCGCEQCLERDSKLQTCDQCAQSLQFNHPYEEIEDYHQGNDELTIAATAWCIQMFKKTHSRLIGFYALDLIRQIASQLPPNDYFYEQCITPFADLIHHQEALSGPVWNLN